MWSPKRSNLGERAAYFSAFYRIPHSERTHRRSRRYAAVDCCDSHKATSDGSDSGRFDGCSETHVGTECTTATRRMLLNACRRCCLCVRRQARVAEAYDGQCVVESRRAEQPSCRLITLLTCSPDLYRLDLTTMEWTQPWDASAHSASSSSLGACPEPRYFHSAEAWGHRLVIFGGEGYAAAAEAQATTDDSAASLATLDDIAVWDTIKNEWLEVPVITCAEGVEPPASRYAHLALVQTVQDPVSGTERSVMVIMGGQDIRNTCEHAPTCPQPTQTNLCASNVRSPIGPCSRPR